MRDNQSLRESLPQRAATKNVDVSERELETSWKNHSGKLAEHISFGRWWVIQCNKAPWKDLIVLLTVVTRGMQGYAKILLFYPLYLADRAAGR